jgi:hypothetical protein
MSAAAVLRRARETGASLWLDGGQINVAGPPRIVGALLDEIADAESGIVAALQLADGVLAAGTDQASQVAGPQAETLLRAELVALIGEVAALLGEESPAAVLDHAVHEPLHAIPASLAFFRECATSLRAAQAARAFIGSLQPCL